MKCGIIEEDYTRTNEKRLIGVTSTDKPYCNRNPCERYSCCVQCYYTTKKARSVARKRKKLVDYGLIVAICPLEK